MQLQTKFRETFPNVINAVPEAKSYLDKVSQSEVANEDQDLGSVNAMSSLPVLATASDVREVVKFLKRKPTGVSIAEMMNAEPRRIFDARKIAAYEFWGIVRRENQRLRLSDRGIDLAEKLEPESRLYRSILKTVPAYIKAVEWIHTSSADVVTHHEIIEFWGTSKTDFGFDHVEGKDEEAAVVSFFSLCHAAEIGTATVGKRGQPARLRVDGDQVLEFLETSVKETDPFRGISRPLVRTFKTGGIAIERVYISANLDGREVDQLRNVLCLADFQSVAVKHSNFENGLLPVSHVSAMEQCQAAVFMIDSKNCFNDKDGFAGLHRALLTEINVAFALYGGRVVLFSNSPTNSLFGEGEERLHLLGSWDFDWESSIRLVTLLKELRN